MGTKVVFVRDSGDGIAEDTVAAFFTFLCTTSEGATVQATDKRRAYVSKTSAM